MSVCSLDVGYCLWAEPLWRCLPSIMAAKGYRRGFCIRCGIGEWDGQVRRAIRSVQLLITEGYDRIVGGDAQGFRLALKVLEMKMGPRVLIIFPDGLVPLPREPTFISYGQISGIFEFVEELKSVSVDEQRDVLEEAARIQPWLVRLPRHG